MIYNELCQFCAIGLEVLPFKVAFYIESMKLVETVSPSVVFLSSSKDVGKLLKSLQSSS